MEKLLIFVFFAFLGILSSVVLAEEPQDGLEGTALPTEFAPTVSASCRGDTMTVTVTSSQNFYGAIHPRLIRHSPCLVNGTGSRTTTLRLNMLSLPGDPDYCGVTYSQKTEERSVQLAVRAHRTLELAEDKLYVVTCGKAGFRNKNETGSVKLGFYNGQRYLSEVIYGRSYTLRVELSRAPQLSLRVRSCFSFGNNNSVPLVDQNGCPEQVMSRWTYSANNKIAEATIYSMFRFSDSKRLNFQCDVLLCKESECPNPTCDSVPAPLIATQPKPSATDTSVLAATTVSVIDLSDKPELELQELRTDECTGICPKWLLWVAIILGVMVLLLLLINLFLCSALTCTCTRTESMDKEPSVMEDYDPYRSWAGSQYGGSRYSLNGKPIYSMSAESNGGSDHYATVPSRHSPSRPGSRYSNVPPASGQRRPGGTMAANGSPLYSHHRKA